MAEPKAERAIIAPFLLRKINFRARLPHQAGILDLGHTRLVYGHHTILNSRQITLTFTNYHRLKWQAGSPHCNLQRVQASLQLDLLYQCLRRIAEVAFPGMSLVKLVFQHMQSIRDPVLHFAADKAQLGPVLRVGRLADHADVLRPHTNLVGSLFDDPTLVNQRHSTFFIQHLASHISMHCHDPLYLPGTLTRIMLQDAYTLAKFQGNPLSRFAQHATQRTFHLNLELPRLLNPAKRRLAQLQTRLQTWQVLLHTSLRRVQLQVQDNYPLHLSSAWFSLSFFARQLIEKDTVSFRFHPSYPIISIVAL
jgi:hypothetical protein